MAVSPGHVVVGRHVAVHVRGIVGAVAGELPLWGEVRHACRISTALLGEMD